MSFIKKPLIFSLSCILVLGITHPTYASPKSSYLDFCDSSDGNSFGGGDCPGGSKQPRQWKDKQIGVPEVPGIPIPNPIDIPDSGSPAPEPEKPGEYFEPSDTCTTQDGKKGKRKEYSYPRKQTLELLTQCVPNETGDTEDSGPSEQEKEEQQLEEADQKFKNMSPATPQLRLNNHPDPHVWVKDNVHFYIELNGSNTIEGDIESGHVQIRAVPVRYHIETGDGTSYDTVDSSRQLNLPRGERMPQTSTSYMYKDTGNFHGYATVTYTGQYRMDNDGPWKPLRSTITKTSDPTLVRVWETEVHAVAKTCNEDPHAWGCPAHPDYADFNNPNPRLRTPDPHTGQKWHRDNEGAGDTGRYGKTRKK